jgi:hypothetical protein
MIVEKGSSCSGHRRTAASVVPPAPAVFVGLVVGLAAWLIPGSARADRDDDEYGGRPEAHGHLNVGFDVEGAVPTGMPRFVSGNSLSGGGGFKIRVGDQFRTAGLRVIPEGGYAFDHLFANDDAGTAYAWDMHRLFGGLRIGFGRILVPVIYGDIGYGWRDTGDPTVAQAGGLAYDAGFALDLHVIPHLGFGGHVEYAVVDAQPYGPHWVALGLHADLAF